MNLLPRADIPPFLLTYGTDEWPIVTGIYVIDDGSVVFVAVSGTSLRSASTTGENRYKEQTTIIPKSLTRADWNTWGAEGSNVTKYNAILHSKYFSFVFKVKRRDISSITNQNMIIGGIGVAILVMAVVFGVYYKQKTK